MNRNISYTFLAGLALLTGCADSKLAGGSLQADEQSPVTISAYTCGFSHTVTGEVADTRSAPTMEDFPKTADEGYIDPVALFGFFLQDEKNVPATERGYFGEKRDAVLDIYDNNELTARHAANILQETVGATAPDRGYVDFMNNSEYSYSTTAGAFLSNDVAAFWRPDAYHYFIAYAPPLPNANLVEPLVLSLRTSAHGIQGEPDYNFLYGRKVLQYNGAKHADPHHKNEGVTIFLTPMLSQLVFHLKCEEMLKGSAVLFGFRVKTYKEAKFHLDSGLWVFDNPDEYEWITRYYDKDYVVPTRWDEAGNSFSLSLFPNLKESGDAVMTGQANPADNTPVVVKALEVCINNTWYEVLNLEEHSGEINGTHSMVGTVVPLAPGHKTDVYLSVKPKGSGLDEWNKLLVTFSNWKREDIYEYDGTLE